jgi:L-aspartate oxidase
MSSHAADKIAGEIIRPAILVPAISESHIRDLTWEHCGIVRDRAGLESAIEILDSIPRAAAVPPNLADFELRNMHQVAGLIASGALWREESRGAHYRTDFPAPRPEFLRPSRASILVETTGSA